MNLFQTICRVGIFMICAQAIVHFRPQEAYEKYLKLLVGTMILIQLFLPVGRLLFRGDEEELALKSKALLESLERDMEEAQKDAFDTQALLEQMTLEEVRRRIGEAQAQENAGEKQEGLQGQEETIAVEPVEEINVRIPDEDGNPWRGLEK